MPLPLRWQWKLDRLRDSVKGFFRGNPQDARPRMCPSCGTLVGTTATKCHVCGASIRFGMAAASRSLGSLIPSNAPATYSLLSVCCLLYGISLLLTVRMGDSLLPEGGGLGALFGIGGIDQKALILLGCSVPFRYIVLEPWRLVTAVFLHGTLLHIAFNMWVLMDIGPAVEEIYGSARYLALFIATGVAGFILSCLWNGGVSVGASGSLLGLIGLLIAVENTGMQLTRAHLIQWVVIIFIIGFYPGSGTDNAAHLGGLVMGYGLGKVVADRQPRDADERRSANMLGWATAIVVVACFGFMLRFFFNNR